MGLASTGLASRTAEVLESQKARLTGVSVGRPKADAEGWVEEESAKKLYILSPTTDSSL